MKSFIYLMLFIFTCQVMRGQEVISATFIGSKTKSQLISQFNVPFIGYGAKYYKVLYTSKDAKGQKDTLSGMLSVPDNATKRYPRLVYTHGTSDCKECVPSRYGIPGGEEGQLGLLFAGLGFVSMLPDYVGMGDGRGFQTYVHAGTTVSATDDLVKACDGWTAANGVSTNSQLFLTGYSQGGFSSMAYHKYLEQNEGPESVTAAAHLSGPYDFSGTMRNLILSQSAYFYPAYIPNTVLGFNEATGTIFTSFSDFFKTEYIPDITSYYQGNIPLTELNTRLIDRLTSLEGASIPVRMIRDDVYNQILNNPDHPANVALRENDLYRWAPKTPTRLFYCTADDQVPYLNSIVARDSMVARGASDLLAIDVKPTANHGECVVPALTQTILFFLGFQQITSSVADQGEDGGILVYPVPATDELNIGNIPAGTQIEIIDITGRPLITARPEDTTASINVSNLRPGVHMVIIRDSSSRPVATHLFVKS
jgi:hypothetical protein